MKKVMAKATIRRALYRWNLEAIGRFGGNLPLFCLVDLLGFATRVAYLKEYVRKRMKLKFAGIALNRRQDGTQTNVI